MTPTRSRRRTRQRSAACAAPSALVQRSSVAPGPTERVYPAGEVDRLRRDFVHFSHDLSALRADLHTIRNLVIAPYVVLAVVCYVGPPDRRWVGPTPDLPPTRARH